MNSEARDFSGSHSEHSEESRVSIVNFYLFLRIYLNLNFNCELPFNGVY